MQLIETLKGSAAGEALLTFLIAMVPVIELRGAIPLGVSMGLHPWAAMAVSVVGNMVPVPFIILFIRQIFKWMREYMPRLEGLISRMERRAEGKWDRVHKYSFLGLLLLVAIPLPGTGAWTGALVAALLDMRLRSALPSIFFGVLIAGFLVTGLTFGFAAAF
jgi:uncharacterized membrane protein